VEQLRVRFTGRKSTLTALMGRLKTLSGPERAGAGKELDLLKRELESECRRRKEEFARRQRDAELARDWIDVTLGPLLDPAFGAGEGSVPGHLHPTSMIQYEIEDVFTSMGFEILDGPHVETDYFNFEALNIPRHHPARDMQDTFFLEDGNILRSHTSAIQVRGMLDLRPPFKVLGPGKVFRCERTDASHEATFHQLEGMMVDRDISVAHLIYFMKVLLSRIFRREVEVRLRPGYFPFVEPGFELDVRCLICGGDGCAVCKHVGWVELVPCGLVHPNVLRYGKIDAEEFSAFAFGLGLDRLVLMRYQIDDIRLFHGADLRFFHQFR
jgi:phenylalanyl-tRNA synthetase alpha chain